MPAMRCPNCGGWDPNCQMCKGEGLMDAACPQCGGELENNGEGGIVCTRCPFEVLYAPEAPPEPIAFHPNPVPCRGCGTILQATYAQQNSFACPECRRPACYVCGCTEDRACTSTVTSLDGLHSQTYACGWAQDLPGMCSFCAARAAYELYQQVTGRPAVDPYYMSLGRTAFAVKGLDYGV